MTKRIPFWFCYALLGLAGCGILDSDRKSRPPFIGEWDSSLGYAYTRADSMSRDSLRNFMKAGGIDLDSFVYGGDDYIRDTTLYKKLMSEFKFECTLGTTCKDTLWTVDTKYVFTRDSIFKTIYVDGDVQDTSTNPYFFTDTLLFTRITTAFSMTQRYKFKSRDSLILFDVWKISDSLNDTLVRIK